MGSGTSLEFHELSHVGRRRANNQDAKGVVAPWNREQYRRRGWLFVVADGMGAHAAGEKASALAVQEVTVAYEKLAARSPPAALCTSIANANRKIHEQGEASAEFKGMGTTCTALALLPRGVLVGHVGDSRAYRVRGGTIEQLSCDHSLAWQFEAQAGGRDAVLPGGVPKNIITRSLGPHEHVEVDLEGPFPVEPDDAYVLCSDGLSGQVADEEIGAIAAALPPQAAAESLVGLTLVRGAPDNVTVIVVRTGDREKSRLAPTDQPWSLDPADLAGARPVRVPWRWLALAGASLLGALICYGLVRESLDTIQEKLFAETAFTVGVVAWAVLSLAFIGTLLAAVISFFMPAAPGDGRQAARAGGKGPYRSYDCRPTPQLVEGIAASVESAADALDAANRQACTAPLARARSAAAAGDSHAAFSALATALAAYTRAFPEPR